MAAMIPVALQMNCGFCRVAIKELSNDHKFQRQKIDIETRENKFQQQFSSFSELDQSSIFNKTNTQRTCLFNRHCNQVLSMFSKKWITTSARLDYLSSFSILAWEKLSELEKRKHSLSNCERCQQKYNLLQTKFPGKPVFENTLCSAVSEIISSSTQKTKSKAVTSVLSPIDNAFKAKFGESFTTTVTKHCPKLGLQKKVTPNDTRNEKRKLCRIIRDDMNEQLSDSTPISILAENQSLASYERQRLSQYFEQKTPKKIKTHSPSIQNWDTVGLVCHLRSIPAGTKIIWQQLADEHGIHGDNRGQICKEYVVNNTDINLSHFKFFSHTTPKRRQRVSRKRLSGGEISCPVTPTSEAIKKKWDDMI